MIVCAPFFVSARFASESVAPVVVTSSRTKQMLFGAHSSVAFIA